MSLFLLASLGLGAELHVHLQTSDGVDQTVAKEPSDTGLDKIGPVQVSKSEVAEYTVTVPPSRFAPNDGGYPIEVRVCRKWSTGKKKGEDCINLEMMALPEADGVAELSGKVKDSSKWKYTVRTWISGELPQLETRDPVDFGG